jgi:hypothetical protein
MLYREIIAVYFQINTEHLNTLRGQNVDFFFVKLYLVVHTVTKKLDASDVLERIFDCLQTNLPTFCSYSQRS